MQDDGLDEQERQLETGLKGLQPVAGLDRDALMFAAGRRAERRKLWGWRAMAGGMAAGWLVTVGVMGLGLMGGRGGVERATIHPQVAVMDAGDRKSAATLFASDRRPQSSAGQWGDSSVGLLGFLGISKPLDGETSSEPNVFDLRNRMLTLGEDVLPTQSITSKGTAAGHEPSKNRTPTYGSMRNNLGEQL